MKHIIYSILLSVGCFLIPFETVFAQADPPECMSVGTNFWFVSAWSSSPFKESLTAEDWGTAYNFADPKNSVDVWDEVFLSEIDVYSTLRFMDWGDTNNSVERVWSDRQQPNADHTPPPGGWVRVSYEWMIHLCNNKQKDMWICIPHRADDTYITNLATLIRDNLDPNLRVYLEYSNEIWNFSGRWVAHGENVEGQGTYVEEDIGQEIKNSGLLANLPNHTDPNKLRMYAQSYRSVQVWENWENVFGSQNFSTRVRKIIAGKSTGPTLGQNILDGLNDNLLNPNGTMPDAYAIAPYFGKGPWGEPDSHIPMQDLYGNIDNEIVPYVQANYAIWTEGAGIDLITYEGGIHTDNRTNNLALNRNGDIYDVYKYYLDKMSDYFPLFNHYVHDGTYDGLNTWGAIERSFPGLQSTNNDHKYRAISDWIDENNADNCKPAIGGNGTLPPGNGGDCPLHLTISGYQNSQIQAANTVTCSAIVNSGSDVECNAGTLVTLKEGFHAKAGSTFHAFIEECTPTDSECEVLTNSSFDSNTDGWNGYSCSASSSGGVANVSGIQSVTNFWEAIFRQENVTLEQGKDYTLSIQAQSQNGGGSRPVTLKVTNSENGTAYNEHNIQLSTSMETFTFPSFNVNTGTNNAYVELLVGHNTTDIQVEFISLKESGDCDTPPPPPGGDCQLLTNTGFDSAFTPWAASGCVPTIESGGTLRMEITTVDAGNAMVAGFEQTGLTFEQGKNYTLTFDARSGSRSIVARINNTTTQTFNLSSNMTTYTLNYSHQGSTTNFGKVEFFLGTSGAWVYLDNIELNGPCNNKEETTLAPNIELYPNPATDNIRVEYELPQSTSANILVFDAFGKVVKSITNTELQAGHQILNMDISDLASGMYFYTLQANEWKATKKFIIVK